MVGSSFPRALYISRIRPGTRDIDQSAPVVSGLEFSPLSVNLDTLPEGSIVDGIASFPLEIELTISDADFDLESVYLFVYAPDPQSPVAAESIVPPDALHTGEKAMGCPT